MPKAEPKPMSKPLRREIEEVLTLALLDLAEWHRDCEKIEDYQCPGCDTCNKTIPAIRRMLDRL